MFQNYGTPMETLFKGILMLAACSGCYLVWWGVAFYPERHVPLWLSGILLVATAHEIKKKRGKIVSLSSGMHRKLLAFYGKGENVILLKFWKQQLYTRLLFLSIIVEISSAN